MKLTVMKPVEIEVSAIRVCVPVRYDEEDIPNDFPFRRGDLWDVVVDIDTGRIRGWPQGWEGQCDMKVVDGGTYTLLDADGHALAERQDYVPDCIPGEYGDYIGFDIAADGTVGRWAKVCTPESVAESFFPEV